jgi:predicted RNA-binding Zn-ribbon protein involved in translation (DUF1610 family)
MRYRRHFQLRVDEDSSRARMVDTKEQMVCTVCLKVVHPWNRRYWYRKQQCDLCGLVIHRRCAVVTDIFGASRACPVCSDQSEL